MMRKKLCAFFVVLVIASLSLASCKKNSARSEPKLASDLSLPLVGTQSQWSLGPLLGKKTVLLAFFTTWCHYCNRSMPYLEDFYEKNKDKNFEVIGIDLDEDEAKARHFNQKYGLTFPLALGQSETLGTDFPVRFLPTFYLVKRNGQEVRKFEGFSPDILEEISKAIN